MNVLLELIGNLRAISGADEVAILSDHAAITIRLRKTVFNGGEGVEILETQWRPLDFIHEDVLLKESKKKADEFRRYVDKHLEIDT